MTSSPPVVDGSVTAVVFDLGGVLIDWDRRHLYRKLFPGDEAAMEAFLADVVSLEWNRELDIGRPWADVVGELVARFPAERDLITAYWTRWPEMLGDAIEGSVEILAELRASGVPVYALSNWAAETFAVTRTRYPFLDWFDGIVISGQERLAKPDPRIFRVLLDRYRLGASATVYVDDLETNVAVARRLGLRAHLFAGPVPLRAELEALGLLRGGVAEAR